MRIKTTYKIETIRESRGKYHNVMVGKEVIVVKMSCQHL